MSRDEFTTATLQQALTRQKFKCACCGTKINGLGQSGQKSHQYGEGAHGHHMKPCLNGGANQLSNCVIICESCHYSVHGGGNYRNLGKFAIKPKHLEGDKFDFPFYSGQDN